MSASAAWLLSGIGAAAALFGAGWGARAALARATRRHTEAVHDLLVGRIEALRAELDRRDEAGDAIEGLLDVRARAADAAGEPDPVRRRLLLLGDDPDGAGPASAAGPTDGQDGAAEGAA